MGRGKMQVARDTQILQGAQHAAQLEQGIYPI